MKRVKARKDEISGASNGASRSGCGRANATVFQGHARFVGPNAVQVNDRILTAEKIFINVGRPRPCRHRRARSDVAYLTNLSMMDVDYLPEHLIVIGGSYIGLEFGQMFAGSEPR